MTRLNLISNPNLIGFTRKFTATDIVDCTIQTSVLPTRMTLTELQETRAASQDVIDVEVAVVGGKNHNCSTFSTILFYLG